MRIAVYTDYKYARRDGGVYAERAFALFLARLSEEIERMMLVGRLDPRPGQGRYRLPPGIELVALPYYESLGRPIAAAVALCRAPVRFWRALDEVDACWLLGPHPLCLVFALLAAVRRRQVVLGVRQDTPAYAASRHPGRRSFALVARALDAAYRLLARRCPTVVVGAALAENYAAARRLLEITVSLVPEDGIIGPDEAARRAYDEPLQILSVGRIDEEKNPLLLAEVLALLAAEPPGWRLVVCGEGPLTDALRRRLNELGVAEFAELRGYVEHGGALADAYRTSHVLLHTSWTEGLPQVIPEAMAAGVPVVATDVGGIRTAVGDAVILIEPGRADLAAAALRRVASEPELRRRLLSAGNDYVRAHTLEAEVERVAEFLEAG